MYNSIAVANLIIDKLETWPTIMKLNKLAYIAHGYCLTQFDKRFLNTPIEVQQFGPVVPVIYHAFRPQGVTIAKKVAINDRGDFFVNIDSRVEKEAG